MTFGQLLQAARIALRDTLEPCLLTKESGLLYFNEAIHEACRRSRLLIDSNTAAICTVPVVAGTSTYVLDSRVLRVRRVKWSGSDTPLRRISYKDLDANSAGWEAHTGSIVGYIQDLNKGSIVLYRKPDVAGTLQLTVVRLPLTDLTATADVPEIPLHLHMKLVPWVVGRMRGQDDTELYDVRKAAAAFDEFDNQFGPPATALQEAFDETQPYDEFTGDY